MYRLARTKMVRANSLEDGMRGLLVAVAAAFCSPVFGADGGISVQGSGSSTATPTCVAVSAGVVTEDKTAGESLKANNVAMSAVFKAVKDFGIATEDLKTASFSIMPVYKYEQNKPAVLTGYTTRNLLTVKVKKVEDLGKVLDILVTSGANEVGRVVFEADTKAAYQTALKAAMADAKEKAVIMAAAEGRTVGEVVSISESVRYGGGGYQSEMSPLSRDTSVPIAAGTHSVNVSVSVVYKVGEAASPPGKIKINPVEGVGDPIKPDRPNPPKVIGPGGPGSIPPPPGTPIPLWEPVKPKTDKN